MEQLLAGLLIVAFLMVLLQPQSATVPAGLC
jgi:hypothetical protein